ncbi:hypothetical protein LTR08_002526 [Meristemomyces frigidus]|nr:hypothetical protein LTR08_002526 [Meristemomyces frigidus]
MSLPSRPSRTPRTKGGRFAAKAVNGGAATGKSRPVAVANGVRVEQKYRNAIPDSDHEEGGFGGDDGAFEDGGRPAKRRKLSIRPRITKGQTTLDGHFGLGVGGVAAPAVFTIATTGVEPREGGTETVNGGVVETVNGGTVETGEVVRKTQTVALAVDGGQGKGAVGRRRQQASPAARSSTGPPRSVRGGTPRGSRAATEEKTEGKKEEKRTLRSRVEGHRVKSELATYFAEYEEVVFGTGREVESVTSETIIHVIDEDEEVGDAAGGARLRKEEKAEVARNGPGSGDGTTASTASITPLLGGEKHQQLNGFSALNVSARGSSVNTFDDAIHCSTLPPNPYSPDPLSDDHFLFLHARHERKEKLLRNQERSKALHEKSRLEFLLQELQGPNWLRTLGVTGVVLGGLGEGAVERWEEKRAYFLIELGVVVGKWGVWGERERRGRLAKKARRAEEGESEDDERDSGDAATVSTDANAGAEQLSPDEKSNAVRSGFKIRLSRKGGNNNNHNNSNNIDLSTPTSNPASTATFYSGGEKAPPPPPLLHYPPPITSFFAKRHLRDAALSPTTHRHGRSSALAFGCAVPDLGEREFGLPGSWVTEGVLRAVARRRRAERRGVEEGGRGKG